MDIKSPATAEQDTIVHPVTSGVTDEIVESAITCPSCNYIGESEFLTCPSCGIIIKKYSMLKLRRTYAAVLSTSSEVDADKAGEVIKSPKKALLVVWSLVIALLGVTFYLVRTNSILSGPPASNTPTPSVSAPNNLTSTNPPAATAPDNPATKLNPLPPESNAQVSVEARSQYELEKQALDAATEFGTSAALDEFISKYPNSEWIRLAIYRRDLAALNEAKSIGTRAAFEEFISKYPNSAWIHVATYLRDVAALNEAKSLGTRAAFEEFLRKYPKSDLAEKARYYRDYGSK